MDIETKEVTAREYEVPVSMIKMKECEAYATCTLPYKPWHPQAMENGVVLVELIWFSLDPFVDFFAYMMGDSVALVRV